MFMTPTAMRMMFTAIVSAFVLSGCVAIGRQGLIDNSLQDRVIVPGQYRAVAICIARKYDEEPYAIGDFRTPVTRVMEGADGRSTELEASNPSSVVVWLWVANVRQLDDKTTEVGIIARKITDTPFLRTNYFFDKLKAVSAACAQ
jgi:hypothetical protein